MKKTTALLAVLLVASFAFAAPAPAVAARSKLKVTARVRTVTKASKPTKVLFKTRMSRPGKVKVTIYKRGKKIRTIKTRGTWYRKTVTWNLRDARGRKVAPGAYTYKVSAVRRGTTKSKRGVVRVKRPPAPAVSSSAPSAPAPSEPASDPPPAADPTPADDPAPEPSPAPQPEPVPAPEPEPSPAAAGTFLGFYVPGAPSNMAPLAALESQVGRKATVVNFFIADTEGFPASRCENIVAHGATPLVTLEFWSARNGGVAAITNGSKDAYLRTFADQAKQFGDEIWIRPFHEMNGDWYPWGGSTNGNSPAAVIAAWRHVHDVFESRGASNVKFVWCVNNDSVPYTTANGIAKYWPGDAYVDYTSIDGYNAGTTQSWSSWRTFSGTFKTAYNTITSLSAKPLFIAETSSVDQGGDKAAWIKGMFSSLKSEFPRIRGVVWFNAKLTYDWRIETTATNVTAFRNAAATF